MGDGENERVLSCECIEGENYYPGVTCGSQDTIDAYLMRGYWGGYIANSSMPGSEDFFTQVCPPLFCLYNGGNFSRYYALPSVSVSHVVDEFVCGPHRTGILCGSCLPNRSAFFHSPDYGCHPDKFCKLGWVFYMLSEILPVTVLFLSVMLLNVSFSSGTITGFILFAQILDSVFLGDSAAIDNRAFTIFSSGYKIFYSFFNLNMFGVNALSFCLLRGANSLDVIAFKYVTVAYALLLVLGTIILMRRFSVRGSASQGYTERENMLSTGYRLF